MDRDFLSPFLYYECNHECNILHVYGPICPMLLTTACKGPAYTQSTLYCTLLGQYLQQS